MNTTILEIDDERLLLISIFFLLAFVKIPYVPNYFQTVAFSFFLSAFKQLFSVAFFNTLGMYFFQVIRERFFFNILKINLQT